MLHLYKQWEMANRTSTPVSWHTPTDIPLLNTHYRDPISISGPRFNFRKPLLSESPGFDSSPVHPEEALVKSKTKPMVSN